MFPKAVQAQSFCDYAPQGSFCEDFSTSDPTSPLSFYDSPLADRWDITVHDRDFQRPLITFDLLNAPMWADHSSDCGPPADPPVIPRGEADGGHYIEDKDDAAYTCKNHLMTAIYGYAASTVILSPNHMVDFTDQEATIGFNISSKRSSDRDYFEVVISPWDTHLQLVQGAITADLRGSLPRYGVKVGLNIDNVTGEFRPEYFGEDNNWPNRFSGWWPTKDRQLVDILDDYGLSFSPRRRDRFELKIKNNGDGTNHLKICAPEYNNYCWVDLDFPNYGWTKGVVQFTQQSYNPNKEESDGYIHCWALGYEAPCPNTWHWDNFYIYPSVPFSIIKAHDAAGARLSRAGVLPTVPVEFYLNQPTPEDSYARFNVHADPDTVEISTDNGTIWYHPDWQPLGSLAVENEFRSFFVPIPAGIDKVLIRANEVAPFGGTSKIWIQDFTVWSQSTLGSTPSPTPTASPTPTPGLTGDINGDGVVNVQDYIRLSNTFGLSFGDNGYDDQADLIDDDTINVQDYIVLSNNFGS